MYLKTCYLVQLLRLSFFSPPHLSVFLKNRQTFRKLDLVRIVFMHRVYRAYTIIIGKQQAILTNCFLEGGFEF